MATSGGNRAAAVQRGDEHFLDTLRRAKGLRGHIRRMSDEADRARMRVTKAIRRAIERITVADPALGRAFDTHIRTGYVCRYATDPLQPITWTCRVTA